MAASQADHRTATPERHRRLLPVGVILAIYATVGLLWIFGGGPVADTIAEATSIPRWAVEVGKGVLFLAITTLVLSVSMRRRTDRIDTAEARTHDRTRELAASEGRNRLQAAALSATANAVVITDRDGTIEWVNEAFETMSGYPASEAVGATPRLLKSGQQDEGFYRGLWDTVLSGQVWQGQVVNRRRDGELYTVSQTITPVVVGDDDAGEVQHFVAIHEDITERVRAARQLEASGLRLQALFDHAIDAIVLADDDGRYVDVNPAFCDLTGHSRGELLGMGPAELAAAAHQPAAADAQLDVFMDTGAESGGFTLRHADGHLVETEYRSVSDIQPGVHLSVLRDVTAHNRMLRALTVAESQFRDLAEKAADIVTKLRIDGDGGLQVDYVNPAATTVLGYPLDQLYGDSGILLRLFLGRDDELGDALSLMPSPAEPTRLATVQVQRADGELVWLEVHSTLTDPDTTPVTIQLVARDVTARSEMTLALERALDGELEAAEQLRTLDAMKDTFLQSVSHELRTPLTSIVGFAQLLADPQHGISPGDTRHYHTRILSNAHRLQQLLDDLLDLDRFARGQIEPKRRPTDVADLVGRMVADVELADHAVDLDLEPITMDLDTAWVERIVANLLRNIVRHTPSDTAIWIRTRATAGGVELTVDDDGPGIPAADRERIIEPFQQGAPTAFSAQPGTGVGLSLVNAFAQLHGGGVAVTESPPGGARVTVTLAHAATCEPVVNVA